MKDRLHGMRVFAEIVEAKTFSAAAQRLGMSKSLASRHVTALEEALAVKLLNRTTRRLALTEAGKVFYEHCARIVQEAELAEQRLTHVQTEPAGLVKLTVVPAFAVRHVVPALGELRKRFPKIRVSLSCSNRTLDPADEGFDLGIRVSNKPPPNLVARRLAPNRAVLCASPAYVERRGAPRRVHDLADHDCIVFPRLAPKGVLTLRRGRRSVSAKITGAVETDDMEAVHAAVLAGLGIGVLPTYMAGDAVRRGRLIPVLQPLELASESGIYLVYWPNRTLPLRVRMVIDFLVDRFGPIPAWDVA